MFKKSITLFLIPLATLLFFTIVSFSNADPFTVKVSALGDPNNLLLGTPVFLRARIINTSPIQQPLPPKGMWYLAGKPCIILQPTDTPAAPLHQEQQPSQPAPQVPPGWETSYEQNLALDCLLRVKGTQQLEYRLVSPASGRIAQPAQITVTIVEPTGIDKEAYDFRESCWKDPEAIESRIPTYCDSKVLEKYPTSTYAVYTLAQQFGVFSQPIKSFDPQLTRSYLNKCLQASSDLDRMVSKLGPNGQELKTPDGTDVQITRKQSLVEIIDRAQQTCSAHRDLVACERIYYNVVAYYYEELLQFDQAAAVLRELSENASDPQLRGACKQTLETFQELKLGH